MFQLLGKLNNTKGFTLVETLVSLVIITTAMGPILVMATTSVNTAARIEHSLTAANLAQEGVEVIRNIRDTNWVNLQAWNTGLPSGTWRVVWNTQGGGLMSVAGNPVLRKDANGIYNYNSGTETVYRRTVTISQPETGHMIIISEVTWVERGNIDRSVRVESHLYDWR